jgi:hypothetical protein
VYKKPVVLQLILQSCCPTERSLVSCTNPPLVDLCKLVPKLDIRLCPARWRMLQRAQARVHLAAIVAEVRLRSKDGRYFMSSNQKPGRAKVLQDLQRKAGDGINGVDERKAAQLGGSPRVRKEPGLLPQRRGARSTAASSR